MFFNSFLISLYSFIPHILTFAHAEEDWDPFSGCELSTTEGMKKCTISDPPFTMDIGRAFQNMIAKLSADFSLFMLKIGSVDAFAKTKSGDWVYSGVGLVIDFFDHLCWLMLAIGIVMALAEAGVAHMNGQGNAGATAINICKATVFTTALSEVAISCFTSVINIGNAAAASIAGMGSSVNPSLSAIKLLVEYSFDWAWVNIVFLLVYLVLYIFFIIGLAKRAVIFLTMLAEGSLLSMSIARGYAGQSQSYVQKMLLFFVGCFLNVCFFNIGCQMIGSVVIATPDFESVVGTILLGFAFMLSSNKVFGYLGTAGTGGDPGTILHFTDHAFRIAQMAAGNMGAAAESSAEASSVVDATLK